MVRMLRAPVESYISLKTKKHTSFFLFFFSGRMALCLNAMKM